MFRPLTWRRPGARGLTLAELLVTMVVAALLIMMAIPSMQDFLLMQRLRGINAQLVTDLQYARAEAPQRNQPVGLYFQSDAVRSCYVIYTSTQTPALRANRCTCLGSAESVCGQGAVALRTVRLPASDGIRLRLPAGQSFGFAYDHITGGILTVGRDIYGNPLGAFWIESYIDDQRVLRNEITQSGRITVCAPASTTVGADACRDGS